MLGPVPGNAPMPPPLLVALQRGIENMYRVHTHLDVRDFVLNDSARTCMLERVERSGQNARAPREQLLLDQSGEDLAMGLYLEPEILAVLAQNDPRAGLNVENFSAFCLAVEGVSHFVYVALCAAKDQQVTALELELQAEVDKFVACLLLTSDPQAAADGVRRRLFGKRQFDPQLDAVEGHRYRAAHHAAHRYVEKLCDTFLQQGRTGDMMSDARRFYRMRLAAKMHHLG